jgi:thioredoxin reductase (NADPH)
VENFPGFEEGITGPVLMEKLKKQAERFGADCRPERVDQVDLASRPFKVTSEGKEHLARSVIIATGATARLLGLESEQKLMGYGVSACATCDGFFFKGKDVCLVGGGDTAMEEALFLTRFVTRVRVIHRRDELRASKIMQDRAFKNDKIEFLWNTVVTEVLDAEKKMVTGLEIKSTESGEVSRLETEGLFVAIGHSPNTRLFEGQLETNEVGYLKTREQVYTSIDGVFACGDVMDPHWRQAVTAAGTGCAAAMAAERFLEAEE